MTMSLDWPALEYAQWQPTYATLHMWSQVVGKIAVALAPPINHSWGVSMRVTARGLSTQNLAHGARSFTIEFDFIDHVLVIRTTDGARRELPLKPRSTKPWQSFRRGSSPCAPAAMSSSMKRRRSKPSA